MVRALALFCLVWVATPAAGQQSACEQRCNQQASDCLKACTGDPKDAQKPEHGQQLMGCLKQCEAQTQACKEACKK